MNNSIIMQINHRRQNLPHISRRTWFIKILQIRNMVKKLPTAAKLSYHIIVFIILVQIIHRNYIRVVLAFQHIHLFEHSVVPIVIY